jgi:plasmid stabilization system protein ParE
MRLRRSEAAAKDLRDILRYRQAGVGTDGRCRYRPPIERAFDRLRADPRPPGSRKVWDVGFDVPLCHIRCARGAERPRPVNQPRHVILYDATDGEVRIIRILHQRQAMDRRIRRPSDRQ